MLNGEENMINSWTGFQPLREVWLGDVWPVGWEKFILILTDHLLKSMKR